MAGSILGLSDSEISQIGVENTILGVLQDFGNKLQKELRDNLDSKINTQTAQLLRQSIVFDITVLGSGYQFELLMNDYWKFVDKGVQGAGGVMKNGTAWVVKNLSSPYRFSQKKPPLSALAMWSNNQGANPFVVQRSVFHKGTKATNFFSEVVDNPELVNTLIKDLEKAGAREVEINLKNAINGISN
jgi:hypothetical protein